MFGLYVGKHVIHANVVFSAIKYMIIDCRRVGQWVGQNPWHPSRFSQQQKGITAPRKQWKHVYPSPYRGPCSTPKIQIACAVATVCLEVGPELVIFVSNCRQTMRFRRVHLYCCLKIYGPWSPLTKIFVYFQFSISANVSMSQNPGTLPYLSDLWMAIPQNMLIWHISTHPHMEASTQIGPGKPYENILPSSNLWHSHWTWPI